MRKKVIVSRCLVVGITAFAIAVWVSYLNRTLATSVSMQDTEYQIIESGSDGVAQENDY